MIELALISVSPNHSIFQSAVKREELPKIWIIVWIIYSRFRVCPLSVRESSWTRTDFDYLSKAWSITRWWQEHTRTYHTCLCWGQTCNIWWACTDHAFHRYNHPIHNITPCASSEHSWIQCWDPSQCQGLCPRVIKTWIEEYVWVNIIREILFDPKNTFRRRGANCGGRKQKRLIRLEFICKLWSRGK